jgi:hypothetical protein
VGIDVSLDPDRCLVSIVATGVVEDADVLAAIEHVEVLSGANPDLDVLADLSRVRSLRVSTWTIRCMAQTPLHFAPGTLGAFVVDGALAYGLARMYSGIRGLGQNELRVFESMGDAANWLDSAPRGPRAQR